MADALLSVEVVYAKPDVQTLIAVEVPEGCSVVEAIQLSGLLQRHPEIDAVQMSVGIFSQPCTMDRLVQAADRIEIYRPLVQDPKDARRQRALKSKS